MVMIVFKICVFFLASSTSPFSSLYEMLCFCFSLSYASDLGQERPINLYVHIIGEPGTYMLFCAPS